MIIIDIKFDYHHHITAKNMIQHVEKTVGRPILARSFEVLKESFLGTVLKTHDVGRAGPYVGLVKRLFV